jgi:hypothetical protein
MAVMVHVGQAGSSRSQQIANLGAIAAKQEMILLKVGPNNPLVTLRHYHNTLSRLIETMGYRDPSRFIGEVPEQPQQQQEPQPDPKMIEAQARIQLEQAKQQAAQQAQAAELQFRQHIELQKLQLDMLAAERKSKVDRDIAELRLESEGQIARERLAAEMQLAEWRAQLDFQAGSSRNGVSKRTRFGGDIG